MSKVKVRCTVCGKWFQSANAKDTVCPDCTQKAKKEKLARTSPSVTNTNTGQASRPVPPPPKPKPVQSGTNQWLDTLSDVKVGQPEPPPARPKLPTPPVARDNRGPEPGNERGQGGPGGYRDRDERGPGGPGNYRENRGPGGYRDRDERGQGGPGNYREDRSPGGPGGPRPYQENRGPSGYREGGYRGPGTYRPGAGPGNYPGTFGSRPRQPIEGGLARGPYPGAGADSRFDRSRPDGPGMRGKPGSPRPKVRTPKPPPAPKPPREKVPPPPPFQPTPEQITQVEMRYLELATPAEFDGIRTQIAQELSIPKSAIKKIIKDLRDRQHIPSWWEVQTYKGSGEEMERIKEAYLPLLPLPDVGVHKTIAEQLSLKPAAVYQAIKQIRLEMNLPQYNDPTLHSLSTTKPNEQEQAGGISAAEQPIEAKGIEEAVGTSEVPALTATTEPPITSETTTLAEAETPAQAEEVNAATADVMPEGVVVADITVEAVDVAEPSTTAAEA